MTTKHPLSGETFPGCHVLIQSGEVENQGEVEGFEGDVLFAPPHSSSSGFINEGMYRFSTPTCRMDLFSSLRKPGAADHDNRGYCNVVLQ